MIARVLPLIVMLAIGWAIGESTERGAWEEGSACETKLADGQGLRFVTFDGCVYDPRDPVVPTNLPWISIRPDMRCYDFLARR